MHTYIRQDADAKTFHANSNPGWLRKKRPVTAVPYYMIVNSTNRILEAKLSPESLDIRILAPVDGGKGEKEVDRITIKPRK